MASLVTQLNFSFFSHVAGYKSYIHDRTHASYRLGALRCCGRHPCTWQRGNVKCSISLHALPSCVLREDENPIMSHA